LATGLLHGCAGASGAVTASDAVPPPGAVAVPAPIVSLLGAPLPALEPPAAFRAQQEELLAAARERLLAAPEDPASWIWVGRRLAYLTRFGEALALYGDALERFPEHPELLRHRGHRHLTVRDVGSALADLELAAERMMEEPDRVEPDGLPNAANQPTGTLRSNVWYHLGLARYLRRDLAGAIAAFTAARDAVGNPDNLVACSYWLYLAHAESGDAAGAESVLSPLRTGELTVIENREYHWLLLAFAGRRDGELLLEQAEVSGEVPLASIGYGIAAWRLLRGEREAGAQLLGQIVRDTPWPAFGHLAAEARLAADPELRRLAGL
jgi:tetratricopeptide (TPR) repeat protein